MNKTIQLALWISSAAASLLPLGSAFALPLVAQNAAQNFNGILTLFPDSDDPNLFYFVPNSSEIAHDASGLPMFGFTYWGLTHPVAPTTAGEVTAGAYMVMSMKLKSNSEQKAALDAFLATGRSIAVVPIMASTVGLTSGKEGVGALSALFSEWNFSQHAGLAEDEMALNAILTPVGARVLKASIDNPAVLKIDYCYKFQGLGPNFAAKIKVHYDRVYDDFQAHAEVGGFWSRAKIDAEVEKLRDSKDVEINIDGGSASDAEYVRKAADAIIEKLFIPTLQMTPTVGQSYPEVWSFSNFSLKITHREDLKLEEWHLTQRDLVTREFCTPLVLSDIRNHRSELIKDADAN